jgi:SpoIIAA-like
MAEVDQVRYITDTEIRNSANEITLIEGNIIFIKAIGIQTDQIALAQKKINKSLSQLVNGKVNFLIDLNKSGKSSPLARKIWKEISDNEEETNKVALFGLHPVARVVATFVMQIVSRNNIKFFTNAEDALNWLKQ